MVNVKRMFMLKPIFFIVVLVGLFYFFMKVETMNGKEMKVESMYGKGMKVKTNYGQATKVEAMYDQETDEETKYGQATTAETNCGQETDEEAKLADEQIVRNLNLKLDCDGWNPDGYNNITGWPTKIVPNIVHYILFDQRNISYSHMLSMLSVIRIHKPAYIYIHCDCESFHANDTNWARVLQAVNETNTISMHIMHIVKPTEINGRKIKKDNANYHASDITRYRLMVEYGGIYLDNDVLVCQPLHYFRKFEFTLNWDEEQSMGAQVLIGHKNARFLKLILKTYEAYDTERWYFNAGELPTMAMLQKYPFLIHRVQWKFGVDAPNVCPYFYTELHTDWKKYFYTFHMCMRGNKISHTDWCLGDDDHPLKTAVFDDDFIKSLNNTFGLIARKALFPPRS